MLATFSTVGTKSSSERKSTRTKSCQDLGLQELEKIFRATRSWPISNDLGPTRENLEVWSLSCGSSLWQTRQSKPVEILINWSLQKTLQIDRIKLYERLYGFSRLKSQCCEEKGPFQL